MQVHKIPLKVLVTGCGRSGTHFMTSLMQAHGIRANHEMYGPDGIVDWRSAPRATHRARFENIFHIYRSPLRTINSFCTAKDSVWKLIERFVPRVTKTDDRLLKSAIYWIEWNKIAEATADTSIMVEDIEESGPDLFRRLGIQFDRSLIGAASGDRNSRAKLASYGGLEDIADLARINGQVHDEVVSLMVRYGYGDK